MPKKVYLTPKEQKAFDEKVVMLVNSGMTWVSVAARMDISKQTVARIMARSREDAIQSGVQGSTEKAA